MAIGQADLRAAAQRMPLRKSFPRSANQRTAFLCHSHKDIILAEGLQALLAEQGLDLYIDWKDATMPEQPNRETAERIQRQIVACDWFLFLATSNSMTSRWCPWELGYADGRKPLERIAVVPTIDATTTHGNEYMQLYRRLDVSNMGQILWIPPGSHQGVPAKSIPFV